MLVFRVAADEPSRPRRYRHGNISTDETEDASGFSGAKLDLLDEYFQQWLHGVTKPTILPEDFA